METYRFTAEELYKKATQTMVPLKCQERYIRQLASLFSLHLKRSELMDCGFPAEALPACSAIVVSGTGQGKSYIFRQMAKSAGLNTIVIDASTLAKETWKGATLGARLLAAKKASKDEKVFRKSVLFIDEIDKIRLHADTSNAGNPMDNLLQLFESGTITVEGDHHEAITLDISQFMIICAGAFDGLESIIEKRIRPKTAIGFVRADEDISFSKGELLRMVKTEDLEVYGMMTELLGRVGVILTIDPMGVEDYGQLLSSKQGSVCWRYSNYLKGFFGVDLEITEDAVREIAEECMAKGIGARAANALTQEWMQEAIVTVEQDDLINKVVLDADDGGCFLRYEFGTRAYSSFSEKKKSSELHTISAKQISGLTEYLCRIYRKSQGDLLILPELQAFLNCSLYHLHKYAAKEDFSFDSLERFARLVHKSKGEKFSTFDTMMMNTGAYRLEEDDEQLKIYHKIFQEFDSPWQAYRLIMALHRIMDDIVSTYGVGAVRFDLQDT